MKRLNFLAVIIIMGISLASCQKDDDTSLTLKGGNLKGNSTNATTSSNTSANSGTGTVGTTSETTGPSVTPRIIPGTNNGGNRTCEEVGMAFMNDAGYFDLCGEKIDYNNGSFMDELPSGLEVSTDGKYVSFELDPAVRVGDKFYIVGAVIVKGSNGANVYFYPDGTTGDSGLSAPVNASGKPAGLSNLTFCFVESNLVIAFKSYMTENWTCTATAEIPFVGYYDFIPDHEGYKTYYTAFTTPATADLNNPVGNLKISDFDKDGLLEVKVDNAYHPELLFNEAYLFVGTLEAYNHSYYTGFPYKTGVITPVPTLTFELPF